MFLLRFSESVSFPIPYLYQAAQALPRLLRAIVCGVGISYALLTGYAETNYGIAAKNPGPESFVHYARAAGAMPLQRRFRGGEAFAYTVANTDPRTAAFAIESVLSHSPHNPNILYQYGIQLARLQDKARLDNVLVRLAAVSRPEWAQVKSLIALRATIK